MKNKITRRQLASALVAGAAVAQSTSSPPSSPAAELEAALAQNQRSRDALATVAVPIDTEPAFHFTA